ncbi:MAG: hypothetical protein ABI488_06090 [Polyangiaceae bacterium]
MTPLRAVLDDAALAELRARREKGEFQGLSLQHMLEFLLSDGIMPESGLPVASFLALEEWARRRELASRGAKQVG